MEQKEVCQESHEKEILCWEVHLASRQRGHAFLTLSAIVSMLVIAQIAFHAPLLTIAAAVVLISSVAEFLFPVRYMLTDRGAHARSLTAHHFLEWRRVQKAYLAPDGVKLSPFRNPSRLEPFRGVFLRFNGQREEIIAAIRRCREMYGDGN